MLAQVNFDKVDLWVYIVLLHSKNTKISKFPCWRKPTSTKLHICILMVLMHFLKTKIQIFPCWRKLTSTNYIPGVCVFMVLLLPKKTKISNYPCWRKLTYTNYIYVFLWVCWFLKRLKSQIFLARAS